MVELHCDGASFEANPLKGVDDLLRDSAVDFCERKAVGNINCSDLPRAYIGLIGNGADDIARTHAAHAACSDKEARHALFGLSAFAARTFRTFAAFASIASVAESGDLHVVVICTFAFQCEANGGSGHFNRVVFFAECLNDYVVAFKSSLSEDLCDCTAGNFKALGLNIGSRRDRTDFNF